MTDNKGSFRPADYISVLGKELVDRFSASSLATTSGLKGHNREHQVRSKIEHFLSENARIGTGCVFSSSGNVSNQQDLVFSERVHGISFSLFDDAEVTYFPCETVYGCAEIKSEIGSSEITDILKKSKSVKSLTRSSHDQVAQLGGQLYRSFRPMGSGTAFECAVEEQFDQLNKFSDQLFFVAIAGSIKLTAQTLKEKIWDIDPVDRQYLPNLVVGLDGKIIAYSSSLGAKFSFLPQSANGLFFSEGNQSTFGFLINTIRSWMVSARSVPLAELQQYYGSFTQLTGKHLT